ncbi:coiled-coil domain containing protein 151 [Anticarsia gemmatalis]|uniref:coiled-coil domain containing protein 151 n=1 Tax=Anticarsia gemmatalis TaxID=129554 RepID=UPI003F776511
MATCYQKHPFEIESEDRLTTINTKIFEIKKKIQLSEGQRKSNYEENEAEKQQNNDLIDTLKKEIKLRLTELAQARTVIGEEEVQIKKYLNEVCPVGSKSADQIIHNLDLKVIEQRKMLDLLKYERGSKKKKLTGLEKEYEYLLIEANKGILVKSKNSSKARKNVSHLENEIHKVLIQWTEAELVKKKYISIRQALIDDSVKFESSLSNIESLLGKQREEIAKLEKVREEAAEMRLRATAATAAEAARAHDAEHARVSERAYFAQRFAERKRELEKLEKRVFPPQARAVVRQESTRSTEGEAVSEELSAIQQMEDIFQKLMKLTGVTDSEEVFDRFRAQRETSQRLAYLQQTTEEEKLELEQTQTTLMAELEAFKFASVKDKDEGQDQITALKEEIEEENQIYAELEKKMDELETLLLEIKRLLYELCKLLDIIPEPSMPEWTAEPRDVQELVMVLQVRYDKACAKLEEVKERQKDTTIIMVPSNPTSAAASVAGMSMHSHSTPKESEKNIPTYKELVQKEPSKGPPSEDEEDIPSRCYLKRQAQLIVDTKCRRKGFRLPYPRK